MSGTLAVLEDISSVSLVVALRSARAALGWSQRQLADQAGLAKVTVARLEAGMIAPNPSTVALLLMTMERHGVSLVLNQPDGGFTMSVHQVAVDPQIAQRSPSIQVPSQGKELLTDTSRWGKSREASPAQQKPKHIYVQGLAGRRISADGVTEPPLAGPERDQSGPD